MAARLEAGSGPGEILLGASTYAMVRDAVEVERVEQLALKGIPGPATAYRLSAVTGLDGAARRIQAPLIGRLEELAVPQDEFDRAGDDRATRWLTVLGSAGVGKSRLVDEFLTSLPTATRLRGRCISYGEGITFLPLIELIRSAVAIDETMPSDTGGRASTP